MKINNKFFNLKVGIIGAGSIVESLHLPVIINTVGIEPYWIFDINPERSKEIGIMYGVSVIDKLLKEHIDNIDILLVATPLFGREEIIDLLTCVKGKTIYFEKPFAISRENHHLYAKKLENHSVFIGFQRRYYPWVNIVKRCIDSGIFGKLRSVDFKQCKFDLKGGSTFLANYRGIGGGLLAESAIHSLDLIVYLTKAIDIKVVKKEFIEFSRIDFDSSSESILITDSGQVNVHLTVSNLLNETGGFIFIFDNARLSIGLNANANVVFSDSLGIERVFILDDCSMGSENDVIKLAFLKAWDSIINDSDNSLVNLRYTELTSFWLGQLYKY